VAGFLLASRGVIHFALLAAMLVGLSMVVASACVFNNYLDRGIDAKMARTNRRALVLGLISVRAAIGFAVVLLALGAVILGVFTNLLTLVLALFGFFAYVVLYGIWKRRSVLGTVVGSISGAVPPVIGYAAVTGRLDIVAGLLFLILVLWQMPHFYAIAINRLGDYAAANIPVLPSQQGIRQTKIQMVVYIVAFIAAASSLWFLGYVGISYLAVTLTLGLAWLALSLRGLMATNKPLWAGQMFQVSLAVIAGWCVMISLSAYLP
jgi:protoheme IX farnesyltransferase